MTGLSNLERLQRLQDLNIKLVDILSLTGRKLIIYAKKHNLELPYEIEPLLKQALVYIDELKNPKMINKSCSVCNKLNPSNADFCCYCGSSLVITRIRHKDGVTRNGDRTMSSKFYIEVIV